MPAELADVEVLTGAAAPNLDSAVHPTARQADLSVLTDSYHAGQVRGPVQVTVLQHRSPHQLNKGTRLRAVERQRLKSPAEVLGRAQRKAGAEHKLVFGHGR